MKQSILITFLLFFTFSVFAQDIPERPNPPRLVNDLANVLSDQEEQQLESELVQFDNQTSTQICIVTLPSLNGYEISDLSFKIGEKWGVGQKGKNNGVVIVFKPKTDNEKGAIFVAVGYGLEGVIPDAVANRNIVDYEMIPRFRKGDVYGGLAAGTKVIMSLAAGEFTADAYQKKTDKKGKSDGFGTFLFVGIILIVIFSIFRGGRGRHYNGGSNLPFWVLLGLMGSSNRGHGSFGNFSGGSGGFGGFGGGGGGFGGFGGGSFGGGGAGGSW